MELGIVILALCGHRHAAGRLNKFSIEVACASFSQSITTIELVPLANSGGDVIFLNYLEVSGVKADFRPSRCQLINGRRWLRAERGR